MPANNENGSMTAMMRLLQMVGNWRQRRAARRRGHLHNLIGMSDRMLADIGVRRADVHAAISGLVPVQHIARTSDAATWTAQVHTLRPECRPQGAAAFGSPDLSAAA